MPPQAQVRGYEFFERIGAGAESVIYRAREIASGQVVAIKHLAIEDRNSYKYLRHIRNEYKTLNYLQNGREGAPRGIVRAYRLIRSGLLRKRKEYALVMEYIDGIDLRKERRYPIGQMADILMQVAKALAGLHARGYIHGDLKPENTIVSPTGRATLVDFGFSCKAGSKATSIRGTRDYMAPEQVDMGLLTEKTDIYNLGATMYFLLTGRFVPALIAAQNDSAHFITSRDLKPVSPRTLNPSIPETLNALVMRCVQKDVARRPSCVEEVLEILKEVRLRFGIEDDPIPASSAN